MRRMPLFVCISLVAGLLSAVWLADPSIAQVKKGKSRPLQTKHLMRGLVKTHCGTLKKLIEGKPSDDKAWEEVELHAALLNEASYILMADGRCPDKTWAEAATGSLRKGSEGVLAAVKARDADAAKKAFGTLSSACKSCHSEHKK